MTIAKKVLLLVTAAGFTAALDLLASNSISARENEHEVNEDHRHHEHRAELDKIKHIVFIVKENRTFDNLPGC